MGHEIRERIDLLVGGQMRTRRAESPYFFDRLFATILGAMAGALVYFTSTVFHSTSGAWSDRWSFSGPLKWFILGGAVVGAMGGPSLARDIWSRALGEARWDISFLAILGLVAIAMIGIVYIALQH
jgi:hypothetical protein